MLFFSFSILVAFNIAILNAQSIGEENNLNHTVIQQQPVDKPGNNMNHNLLFLLTCLKLDYPMWNGIFFGSNQLLVRIYANVKLLIVR